MAPHNLYPFQNAILDLIKPQDQVALFVDMRLGKTVTIIRWLKHKKAKRTLVVCPLSIMDTWKRELELEGIIYFEFRTFKKELVPFLALFNGVVLTNYEALLHTELQSVPWECVILDESQKIRRHQAKISRICSDSFKDVPLKAILTGTPAPESPLDYFQQFKFLKGQMLDLDNIWDFKFRHMVMYGSKFIPTHGAINLIKGFLQQNAIVVTRKNPAVQSIFKNEKIYSPRFIEMEKDAYSVYKKMERDWAIGIDSENALHAKFAIVVQNYLHQMASGYLKRSEGFVSNHKLKELLTICQDEINPEDKVVIFCKHLKELQAICESLPGAIPINGEVPPENRTQRIKSWTSNNHNRFLVCQIATASMGINLSAADTAIYFSNSWALQDRLQSEDRILSPENNTLLYIDLITKNTIDEDIVQALQDKRDGQNIDFFLKVYSNFRKRTLNVKQKQAQLI